MGGVHDMQAEEFVEVCSDERNSEMIEMKDMIKKDLGWNFTAKGIRW